MTTKRVPQPVRSLSGVGQAMTKKAVDVTQIQGPAWGCKGLDPLRSSIPCPSAVPCLSAHSSRDMDARYRSLRRKGKGCAPCTPARYSLARRSRVVKLANSHQWSCSGHNQKMSLERLIRDVNIFPFPHPHMLKSFTVSYGTQSYCLSVELDEYRSGGLAVQLLEEPSQEYFTTVSVNVEGLNISDDEFVFKTYSENEGLFEAMLAAGIVEPTGRSVSLGFAGPQPICRLAKQ